MLIITKTLKIFSQNYKEILSLLNQNGEEARLVGGCVRDALLQKESYDIDIATTIWPSEVTNILSKMGIKVIPTGINFGTVTAILKGEHFQITTLRKDIECTGRRAKVLFTKDFAKDAERRDFTINALSYCPFKNKIYDYFNGFEDLKQKKVIFIGDAKQRIKEDYLRILRFFRFSSYYANDIDVEGLAACVNLKNGLTFLSRERIKIEIDRLLVSPNISYILQTMFDSGILSLIFPVQYYSAKFFEQMNLFKLGLAARYAILFYDLENLNLNLLLNLKYSKQDSAEILSIWSFITLTIINELALKKIWYSKLNYQEYLFAAIIVGKLNKAQVKRFIDKYEALTRLQFPLTGHDLLKIHVSHKDIGKQLDYLKDIWLESDCSKSKNELLKKVKL